MCAENMALNAQRDDLAHELEAINKTNKNLADAIAVKLQTIAALMPNHQF